MLYNVVPHTKQGGAEHLCFGHQVPRPHYPWGGWTGGGRRGGGGVAWSRGCGRGKAAGGGGLDGAFGGAGFREGRRIPIPKTTKTTMQCKIKHGGGGGAESNLNYVDM